MNPKLTLILFILFSSSFSMGQSYQVLHVKGEILYNGIQIKSGDKIHGDKNIEFGSNDAMAAVLSKEKGRYIIKANPGSGSSSNLVYILNSTLSPVRGNMSTRSGAINNTLDLAKYFGEKPFVWAGDLIVVNISKEAYEMDDDHFFFLRYQYNNETVNKRLRFEGTKLIMDKNEVFSIENQPVIRSKSWSQQLFFYDYPNEETELITDIQFVLLDKSDIENFKNGIAPDDFVLDEISQILSDLYGKCDLEQLIRNF